MVYRCYVRKKPGFDTEAQSALKDLRDILDISSLTSLLIYNRYDVEGISVDEYENAKKSVFSEPQCDDIFDELPNPAPDFLLAVEALPGQYDQRADSCAQCIQILTGRERPTVNYAKIYAMSGIFSPDIIRKIKTYLINPVEAREAALQKPPSLLRIYESAPLPGIIHGFLDADPLRLANIAESYSLAMDTDDLAFLQAYFKTEEAREPTVTELRVIDTYWSDHCRHTTFSTHLDKLDIDDPRILHTYELYLQLRNELYGNTPPPLTLMDMATIGAKILKKRGFLANLDISEEVNACSIHVDALIDGEYHDWLLMFKNETHNHPTEIEPFGGAATCIGGAIRDPLSGRAYVFQAMRVTGSADPTAPIDTTLPGKLPQRRITTAAAAGYSSYGNQIGLATGLVHELYHPKYAAKRMEVGAVVGAAPRDNVIRSTPMPGDIILLLGGRTGRDGCGGATGSSKTHDLSSLASCGSEVQKGNAPEERKLQRLFRNPEAATLIKRCNDFGAGGVSVAVGELADGISVNLSNIKRKYEGLDATELAISESQERMAVVIAPHNLDRFLSLADSENLEAAQIACVTDNRRVRMSLDGTNVVDISRDFLNTNGAPKHTAVLIRNPIPYPVNAPDNAALYLESIVSDLSFCSRRGLAQRFDSTVGAASVLMPYGGRYQRTPAQVMAALLPAPDGNSETCSVMSFAFDPFLSDADPFEAARQAVIISIAKLVAAGCDYKNAYLSFQEYFERLKYDPIRWGKPVSALLGALDAQISLQIAAIGGKDSMSGSFLELDVPPTLISFAIAPCLANSVISPELKRPHSSLFLFRPESYDSLKSSWAAINKLILDGTIISAWAVCEGSAIGGIFKMALGNNLGFHAAPNAPLLDNSPGAIICESLSPIPEAIFLGTTINEPFFLIDNKKLDLNLLRANWEKPLESVFPTCVHQSGDVPVISSDKPHIPAPAVISAVPRALIPAFPGTNSEYDTALAVKRAGGEADIFVIRNLTPNALEESVSAMADKLKSSHMLILPGGFSSGDEPEGSGKFIAAFFRNPRLTDAVHELLYSKSGLILGICNGFQALIKLGLLPYGKIRDMDENCPTLTFNSIGRHQSAYVTTRISSVASPWLSKCNVGELYSLPISHGEGRFTASQSLLDSLVQNGQIAAQYTDSSGIPSMDIEVNPNGSLYAIEGILSPDGRVFGKMAHTERRGLYVAKNIHGNLHQPIFEAGVSYFK